MTRLHDLARRLVPEHRHEWIDAHEAELDHIPKAGGRLRWRLGIMRSLPRLMGDGLHGNARRSLRPVTTLLAGLVTAAGAALLVAAFADGAAPASMWITAVALLVQGGFVLACIPGGLSRVTAARRLLLLGSALAVVGGIATVAIGVAIDVRTEFADPEYGPMVAALLVAMLGFATWATLWHRLPDR